MFQKMLQNVCIATGVFSHIFFHPLHFILNPNRLRRPRHQGSLHLALSVGRIYTSTSCENQSVKQCWNCSPIPNCIPYTPYEPYFGLCAMEDVYAKFWGSDCWLEQDLYNSFDENLCIIPSFGLCVKRSGC